MGHAGGQTEAVGGKETGIVQPEQSGRALRKVRDSPSRQGEDQMQVLPSRLLGWDSTVSSEEGGAMNIWEWARRHGRHCWGCHHQGLEQGTCDLYHHQILREEEDEDGDFASIKCGPLGMTVWAGNSGMSSSMEAPDGWVIERVEFRSVDHPIYVELLLRRTT